ncbi:MAG TPA: Mrp/NBP35 family ATP-binding protein [Nitrospirota bacterium]|nr:Mrp/NBP35 family ATP-binding protein [Nitrospirota bacterium]
MTREQKKEASGCTSASGITVLGEQSREYDRISKNLQGVDCRLLIMSGKGGVGKSSVAANIAVGLSLRGKQVGLMDIDIHGPSIPMIVGLEGAPLMQGEGGLLPAIYSSSLKVMSIGLLLNDRNDAVIWRAPMKHGLITQFLSEVAWGDLDFLVVDCPPGTGDELISITQLLEKTDGAIIVTTPQDVALNDVRKSITFCRQANVPILGMIENMSGYVCPCCKTSVDIFKTGGGERLAGEMDVPFLGRIPLDPRMVEHSDQGRPLMNSNTDSPTVEAFHSIISSILMRSISRHGKEGS